MRQKAGGVSGFGTRSNFEKLSEITDSDVGRLRSAFQIAPFRYVDEINVPISVGGDYTICATGAELTIFRNCEYMDERVCGSIYFRCSNCCPFDKVEA